MLDYAAHIAAEIAHAEKLARIPGWQDYIKDKARRMAKHYPALYAVLPERVDAVINEEKEAACSESSQRK